MKILAKAFAKINPRLKVVGKLDNGYHELAISYLSINLADRMTFKPAKRISVSTDMDIPLEENLCYIAAKKLKSYCSVKSGATITLEKRIPIGGGLGGGSSNAATTLICLNRLWNCKLSRIELIEVGKKLGADVPFFFYGGYCTGKGRGSELRKKENLFIDRLIPLIVPPFSQLTPQVYSRYDQLKRKSNCQLSRDNRDNPHGIGVFKVENDLQQAAIELNPELERYLKLFQEASTIKSADIAGSGSSVFGISERHVSAREIKKEVEADLSSISEDAKLFVTRPTNHGQLVKEGV